MTGPAVPVKKSATGADKKARMRLWKYIRPAAVLALLPAILFTCTDSSSGAESALAGMQKRYAGVESISGSFQLTSRDFGYEESEWGTFQLKKPAFMRWEYENPEGKLLVTDGKNSYYYDPEDNQVTVEAFTAADLENSPLRFLLGSGAAEQSYYVMRESPLEAKIEGASVFRLTPKQPVADYSFLVLEIDPKTCDLVRLVVRENSGTDIEYVFSDLKMNVKINDKKAFKFKIPKDAVVLEMEAE